MDKQRDQHEIGIPERRRGQQMGDERGVLHHRDDAEWDETPEINGDLRASESEFFGDESSQHFGGDAVTSDHNSPSTPGAIPTGQSLGQSGGERFFNRNRQKSKK